MHVTIIIFFISKLGHYFLLCKYMMALYAESMTLKILKEKMGHMAHGFLCYKNKQFHFAVIQAMTGHTQLMLCFASLPLLYI